MKSRIPAVILAIVSCTPVLIGQRPQAPEATFRVQVEAVELDAVVTDAQGNLVTNLTKDDFQIFEEGKPQTITSFALVNIPIERTVRPLFAGNVIEPDVQSNTGEEGRLYVIALDEALSGEQALRARRFLRRFIEQYFAANDLGAVVFLGRATQANSQDLTSNPRLLLKAIDSFVGGLSDGQTPPPTAALPSIQGGGGAPTPPPLNFERDHAVRRSMESLRAVTDFMATLHGRRKALLLFSYGYQRDSVDMSRVIDYRGGVLKLQEEDLHRAVTAATRNNITIYPIDPRGLTSDGGIAESETGISTDAAARLEASLAVMEARQSLSALADVTGGFAVVNSNSFDNAFGRIVRENSSYYVLGYSSTDERRDGRYRRLQIRVTRPGLTVRSRGGYMAPLRNERPPALVAPPTNVSLALTSALRSAVAVKGVPIRVFAAPFKGTSRDATVVIAIEVEASQLGLMPANGGYAGAIEISTLANDTRNKIFPGQTQKATLTLKPDTYARVMQVGLRTMDEMHLPAGRYQIRVAAGNQAGKAGSVVYDLEVPDFTKGPLVMSGLAVTSLATSQTVVLNPKHSLSTALPGSITASRDFAPGDRLMIFAEAYDNQKSAAHTVELVAELREEGGRAVKRVMEERSSKELQGRAGGYGFTAEMSLDGVAAGTYVIHVDARSTADGRPTASREIQIRVR